MKEELYYQLPKVNVDSEMRQVFIYSAANDTDKLHELAEKINDSKTGVKCLVKWMKQESIIDEEDLKINLLNSQILLILVTPDLLDEIRNKKVDGEKYLPLPIRIMKENNRPYFPIATVSQLLESYCDLDKQIHGLSLDDVDFKSKLKEQLSKYILDEELVKNIQEKAFVDQIFMSYRKIDTEYAQNLMNRIHDLPDFKGVSIWIDRFLTAGEEFNQTIFEAIKESSAFAMAITQNIASKREDGEDNFVVEHEYPYAKKNNCNIVPIKDGNISCDLRQLQNAFDGITEPINLKDAKLIFRKAIKSLPSENSYTTEQNYYLGRAYLAGYFVERNNKVAIDLLTKSANGLDEYALSSAIRLAELYNSSDLVDGIDYNLELEWRLRASEISEKIYGLEHDFTASTYNNSALVHFRIGEYEKALEGYNKVLTIDKKIFGEYNSNTASSYNNIALIYSHMGEYQKALKIYNKALAIFKEVLDENHPSTATSYNNIAGIYSHMGEYQKALEFHNKALIIEEKALGENHPSTAISYNNIGDVYFHMGEYQKALEFHNKALSIYKKVLDKNHPNTATSYNNIALVYSHMGEYEKALEGHNKVLVILKQILSENHPNTATSYNNIAFVYSYMGEYEKALEGFNRDLEINKKALGENHPSTAISYNNIAFAYANMGEYQKSLEFYQKALPIYEKVFKKNHPNVVTIYISMFYIYASLKQEHNCIYILDKISQIQKSNEEGTNTYNDTTNNLISKFYQSLEALKK